MKKNFITSFRFLSTALVAGLFLVAAQSSTAQNAPANTPAKAAEPIYKDFKTEMVLEAKVNIGSMVNVGEVPDELSPLPVVHFPAPTSKARFFLWVKTGS